MACQATNPDRMTNDQFLMTKRDGNTTHTVAVSTGRCVCHWPLAIGIWSFVRTPPAVAASFRNPTRDVGGHPPEGPIKTIVPILVPVGEINPDFAALLSQFQPERYRKILDQLRPLCRPSHLRQHSTLRIKPEEVQIQEFGRNGLPLVHPDAVDPQHAWLNLRAIPVQCNVLRSPRVGETRVIWNRLLRN